MLGNQQKQAPRQTDPWCGKVTNIQALGRLEQGGCEFKTSLVTEQAVVFKTNNNTNTHVAGTYKGKNQGDGERKD